MHLPLLINFEVFSRGSVVRVFDRVNWKLKNKLRYLLMLLQFSHFGLLSVIKKMKYTQMCKFISTWLTFLSLKATATEPTHLEKRMMYSQYILTCKQPFKGLLYILISIYFKQFCLNILGMQAYMWNIFLIYVKSTRCIKSFHPSLIHNPLLTGPFFNLLEHVS